MGKKLPPVPPKAWILQNIREIWEEALGKLRSVGGHQISASQLLLDSLKALLSFLLCSGKAPLFFFGDQQQN